jgi:C-terminal processing protease CtpA/Prc
LNRSFPFFYAIRFGFPDAFTIVYRPPGGEEDVVVSLEPSGLGEILIPRDPTPNLDLELHEEEKVAILTVRTFIFYRNEEEFTRFIDDAFRKIAESGTEYLIIDLRGNDGGNPFCSSHLLSYIEPYPIPYFAEPYGKYSRLADPVPLTQNHFDGEVFVLIDGKCFSSTGHLCGLLKFHGIGTLVGSETGGTFTCNDDKKVMHLKNTRFNLRVARGSFRVAVDGMDKGRGVIPDHRVERTIEDVLEGEDAAMTFTLDLIRRSDSAP